MKSTSTNDVWSSTDGYIIISTTAYNVGVSPSGSTKYRIDSFVMHNKKFTIRAEESLIMTHSTAAVFDASYSESGKFGYRYQNNNNYPYQQNQTDEQRKFSSYVSYFPSNGIEFKFTYPGSQNVGGGGYYSNTTISQEWARGSYGILVSNDTNIQTTYIHNENLFGDSLSISLGASVSGVSVSVTPKTFTPYPARPLTIYK